MTWLYSLYWLGAFAAAGPVLFHMWRRMPRGERQFSTLMFLSPSPPRITSRSRVEHWLLLLLRAATLLLLVFAFTRPLWRVPITEPDEAATEQMLAIVVDTSASMRRIGVWDDLSRQLDERLNKLSPQTRVALFRFDQKLVPVASFAELKSMEPSASRELVRARLKELKPTWEATRLGDALVQVAMVLQEIQTEHARPVPQRIWLVSDLQSGAETVSLQGYEWPDDLPVELLSVHSASPSNAGLQVVEQNLESGDATLRVRVTNAADSGKDQFTLKWDTPESPELPVYVPPGQSRILIPPKLPAGVVSTSLRITGDDDDFDNQVFVAKTVPETRLVVYCGSQKPDDATGARFYLDRLFAASRHLQIELRDPSQANLASADSQPSLIVLTDPAAENEPLIRRHLNQGGVVLIVADNAESMLSSLNLCGRTGVTVTEANVPKYAMLGEINFADPLFAPFAESQFSDFTGIRFWKHRQVLGLNVPESKSDKQDLNSHDRFDHVLARFDDGDPAIVELPVDRGKVYLFASGWQPDDSQFARSSKFPMLIFRLLEQSAGAASRSESQVVGNSLSWPTTSRVETAAAGSARLPDGTVLESLPLNEPFLATQTPGLYTLSVPGRTEQIAVNLAADESRTAPMNQEQLESFGLTLKGDKRLLDPQQQRQREHQLQLAEMEKSQKLWQWVLLAVIGFLILETAASGWFASGRQRALAGSTTGNPA